MKRKEREEKRRKINLKLVLIKKKHCRFIMVEIHLLPQFLIQTESLAKIQQRI